MLSYRLHGNLRIELASALVTQHIKTRQRYLDLGCGIGLVCETVAKSHQNVEVVGCDLSPENIWYCRQTVKLPQCTFITGNVLDRSLFANELGGRRFDTISLIDVLEHIPLGEHQSLLSRLIEIGTDDLTIVLTFPSPAYQSHLARHDPAGLQPIDESITLSHLTTVCDHLGLEITSYALRDVWLTNQYVHCVLKRPPPLTPIPEPARNPLSSLIIRIGRSFHRRVILPFLKWKYVTRVFASRSR